MNTNRRFRVWTMDCSHQTWASGGPAEIRSSGCCRSADEFREKRAIQRSRSERHGRGRRVQRSGLWDVVIQAEASLTHVAQRYSRFSGKQTLSGTEDGRYTVTLRKPDRVCKYPCIWRGHQKSLRSNNRKEFKNPDVSIH